MFRHARELGVTRFFVVDNGSTDGTQDWLLAQPDAHVFETAEVLHRQDIWRDVLFRDYGRDRWWLLIDPDEMFQFPHMESVSFRQFLDYLDSRGFTALHSVFLDTYPEGRTSAAVLRPGQNPLEVSPWFDPPSFARQPHRFIACDPTMDFILVGGVRQRVFGLESSCSKFPLVKYRDGMFVPRGAHYVEGAAIADVWGALLHFKFVADFREKSLREAERAVYWMGAHEYKTYAKRLGEGGDIVMRTADSMRYQSPSKLLEKGVMRSSPTWDAYAVRDSRGV